ncbi:MAG: hypothetical protein U5L09_22895 [Bacteroidales bacterium]|nr:hypothetical protein [Bacteroidales bacterium]
MSFGQFLIGKTFLHLGFILVAGFAILFITIKALNHYTMHGEEYTLPNYSDLTLDELEEYQLGDQLEFVIIDSLYNDKKEPEPLWHKTLRQVPK